MAPAGPLTASASGSPAGYGRSCTNCSRAKCKCILRPDGGSCERCHRLSKECHQMTTSRRRIAKKPTASRTAQLEEKLDDLVSILRASQQPNQQSPPTSSSTPHSTFTSRLDSLATAATSTSSQAAPAPQDCMYATSCHAGPSLVEASKMLPPSIDDTYQLPEPDPHEAEAYFRKFREWLRNFPFVVFPPDQTAKELRRERPFLWLVIMTLTTMSMPQHQILQEKIRNEFISRAFVNNERNMDFLLGLIALLSWATMNAGPKPFFISYCQQALTVLYELGLTRDPMEEQYFTSCFKVWLMRPQPLKQRTMEERRAVVSLWFITSVIASFIGKMDTLRWSPHMDDCLAILEREREHPGDELLVKLVQLQRVADEAHRMIIADAIAYSDSNQAPSYVHRGSLFCKFKDIKESISHNLATHAYLQSHILGAEILVQSVGLTGRHMPSTQRIDAMYLCLKAVRAWYDNFFTVPLEVMPGFPFSLYIQLLHAQISLYRITVSDEPGWDKDIVRNTANLLEILDRIADLFDRLQTIYTFKADVANDTIFVKTAKVMRTMRSTWEPVLAPHLTGMPTPNSQVMPVQHLAETNLPGQQVLEDHVAMDFSDINWMTDVFGPWEF